MKISTVKEEEEEEKHSANVIKSMTAVIIIIIIVFFYRSATNVMGEKVKLIKKNDNPWRDNLLGRIYNQPPLRLNEAVVMLIHKQTKKTKQNKKILLSRINIKTRIQIQIDTHSYGYKK